MCFLASYRLPPRLLTEAECFFLAGKKGAVAVFRACCFKGNTTGFLSRDVFFVWRETQLVF